MVSKHEQIFHLFHRARKGVQIVNERVNNRDRQTDGQTDGRTDRQKIQSLTYKYAF